MAAASPPRPIRHTALAFGLCLLTLAFAMEAKMAWYGPNGGPGSDVRAAKALPADTPEVVSHGVPVPNLFNPQLPYALLATFAFACLLNTEVLLRHNIGLSLHPVSAAHQLNANLFFRPPPAR